MKVLQILHPGLGGTSTVAFMIVESQKFTELNIENYFIFNGNENLLKSHILRCKQNKIKFFFFKLIFPFSTAIKVYLCLKKIKPDMIINHSNIFAPTFLYKILSGKKFIYVDHSPDNTRKFKDWIKSLFCWILSDYIVFVSYRKTEDFIYKYLRFFKKRYSTILNAVNLTEFKIKKRRTRYKNIGMAARFVDDKLQILLLESFKKNIDFFKLKKIKLHLAGDGVNLKKYLLKYKKYKNIVFNGNLHGKKLINWFKNMDLYAHISKDETTSTSILQAISCDTPLLISDVEGNKSLIHKLKVTNYCKITKNNEDDIGNNIKKIIKDKNSFYNARKLKILSQPKIDLKIFFKQYFKIYNFIK